MNSIIDTTGTTLGGTVEHGQPIQAPQTSVAGVLVSLVGVAVVIGAVALGIQVSERALELGGLGGQTLRRADADFWTALRVGITPVTLGLLVLAVGRRLYGSDRSEDSASWLRLAGGASMLAYAVLIVKSTTEPGADAFWAPIGTFALLSPASVGVLLFLSAGPSGDGRLLGTPSKFGRGVAASAIACSIAFALKAVSSSDAGDEVWEFIAFTASPCAAGFLLLGASRQGEETDVLSVFGGLISAAAGVAYGLKLVSLTPILDFWLFAGSVIVPVSLGVLAVLASQKGPRGPLMQLLGLVLICSAVAIALKVASASQLEASLLNFSTLGTRLFGWEALSINSVGDTDFWLVLAHGLTPLALGALVFLMGEESARPVSDLPPLPQTPASDPPAAATLT
jgi:hypothetical protein